MNSNTPVIPSRPSNRDFREILSQRAEMVRLAPLVSQIALANCLQIAAPAQHHNFQGGKTIYFEGDSVRQIYLLLSGCVKVTQIGSNGYEDKVTRQCYQLEK